jgi:hypothetical protein
MCTALCHIIGYPAGSFPEAIEIVKSKIKRKEESSLDKADILMAIRSEIKKALDNHRTISQNERNSRIKL